MGNEGALSRSMCIWPRHIYRFKRKYYKEFGGNPLFGSDIIDLIHKRVKVFLKLCNIACLDDVETGALTELGKLQWCI